MEGKLQKDVLMNSIVTLELQVNLITILSRKLNYLLTSRSRRAERQQRRDAGNNCVLSNKDKMYWLSTMRRMSEQLDYMYKLWSISLDKFYLYAGLEYSSTTQATDSADSLYNLVVQFHQMNVEAVSSPEISADDQGDYKDLKDDKKLLKIIRTTYKKIQDTQMAIAKSEATLNHLRENQPFCVQLNGPAFQSTPTRKKIDFDTISSPTYKSFALRPERSLLSSTESSDSSSDSTKNSARQTSGFDASKTLCFFAAQTSGACARAKPIFSAKNKLTGVMNKGACALVAGETSDSETRDKSDSSKIHSSSDQQPSHERNEPQEATRNYWLTFIDTLNAKEASNSNVMNIPDLDSSRSSNQLTSRQKITSVGSHNPEKAEQAAVVMVDASFDRKAANSSCSNSKPTAKKPSSCDKAVQVFIGKYSLKSGRKRKHHTAAIKDSGDLRGSPDAKLKKPD